MVVLIHTKLDRVLIWHRVMIWQCLVEIVHV
jgi:hypothetical protein